MSDHGTIEIQIRGNKVEVAAENAVGGDTCMVDRWHTYADFLRDLGLIEQDHHDAFNQFMELWYAGNGKHKPGGEGDGSKYQSWITFGARLGPARLRILHDIRESDPPSSADTVSSLLEAVGKAYKLAVQQGKTEDAAALGAQVGRLMNTLKMREAIINAHRLSNRLRIIALHEALERAQEVFQMLLDEKKKLDENKKSGI